MIPTTLTLLALLVHGSPQTADDETIERDALLRTDQLDLEHALSLEFETPHTKWAKPYAGGKVRILFVAGYQQGSSAVRGLVELLQRFDLDAEAVYYETSTKRLVGDGDPRWYTDPEAGTKRALRLLEKPFDVYFFNLVAPGDLPESVRAKLLDAVREGAGIVLIGAAGDPLAGAEKLESRPTFLRAGDCFLAGRGRAVILPPREQIPYDAGWEVALDYQMEEQGRALLWAADRVPQAELQVSLAAPEIARADLPRATVMVTWRGGGGGARLEVHVRRFDGERTPLESVPLGPAEAGLGSVTLVLPRLRAGQYHIDAFLKSADKIFCWATAPFAVAAERGVRAVELARPWGEVGERLEGRARLFGELHEGDQVEARLLDRRGRILQRANIAAQGDSAPFAFEIAGWMPMLLRLEAALSDQAGEVSAAHGLFRVTKRRRGQFNFVVWNYPGGDLGPYGVESMARRGVTAILQGGPPPVFLAAHEMAYIPYTTRICPSSHSVTGMLEPDGVLKGGCFNDPEKSREMIRAVVEREKESRGHGVLAYSLGDENAVRASCLSPHCLLAYRKYLEETYTSIAALNAAWGSELKSFADVDLLREGELPAPGAPEWFRTYYEERLEVHRTDSEKVSEEQIRLGDLNDEMRALQAGSFARWYDRQAFQCVNYVQLCQRFAAAFAEIDPQAITGFEGVDSFSIRRHTTRTRQGGDVDLTVRELGYYGPYAGPGNELVRSIAPRGLLCGNWMGYSKDAATLLRRYWEQVTNGMNTVQWWRVDCLGEYHGFLALDFSVYPATSELLADTQVVRDGLGDLLLRSEIEDDGVAMLYSLPSTYVAHFEPNRGYGEYPRGHQQWFQLIHDAGLQFRYVTDRMLRRGEFDGSRYRVLILPLAFAIGEKEAEAIREFAHGGGTVIADVRPGVHDGHTKPLTKGILDDLFGIERRGRREAQSIDRMYVAGELHGQKLDMRWGNWHGKDIYPQMRVDPSVKATTGRPLGTGFYYHYWNAGAPLAVVNDFGKGRAVLLNFAVEDAPAGPLLRDLLAAAGTRAQVAVEKADGGRVEDVEVTRWRNGDIALVSLFGSHQGELRITLPEERHVYDLKLRRALGPTRSFTARVLPDRAEFFALLPRPAPAAVVVMDRRLPRGGSVVRASVSVPGASGLHALRLRLSAPDGGPAEWFERLVIAGEEPVALEVPFAFNDPPGAWRLSAIDLYGGGEAAVALTID